MQTSGIFPQGRKYLSVILRPAQLTQHSCAEMTGNVSLLCRYRIIFFFFQKTSHLFFIVLLGAAALLCFLLFRGGTAGPALGMSGVEGKWPTCESH